MVELTKENIPKMSMGNLLLYIVLQVMEDRDIPQEDRELIKKHFKEKQELLEIEATTLFEQKIRKPLFAKTEFVVTPVKNKLEKLEVIASNRIFSKTRKDELIKACEELNPATGRQDALRFLEYGVRGRKKTGRNLGYEKHLRQQEVDLEIYRPSLKHKELIMIIRKKTKKPKRLGYKPSGYIIREKAKLVREAVETELADKDKVKVGKAKFKKRLIQKYSELIPYEIQDGLVKDFSGVQLVFRPGSYLDSNSYMNRMINYISTDPTIESYTDYKSGRRGAVHIDAKPRPNTNLIDINSFDRMNTDFIEIQMLGPGMLARMEVGDLNHEAYAMKRQDFRDPSTTELRPYMTDKDFEFHDKCKKMITEIIG